MPPDTLGAPMTEMATKEDLKPIEAGVMANGDTGLME